MNSGRRKGGGGILPYLVVVCIGIRTSIQQDACHLSARCEVATFLGVRGSLHVEAAMGVFCIRVSVIRGAVKADESYRHK